ncbi:hypothetical protein K501DRAFT_228853 [Backusella circina FSU 941]|nr:hypothetical protein K501DRAFT_228853 [Backusella circina FSU 941]
MEQSQEEREEFIENFLNREADEESDDELFQQQQEETIVDEMPKELATPISLTTEGPDGQEKKKKKKKKRKGKTSKLPEAGTALGDDYTEVDNEDLIEDPYDPEHSLGQRVEYAIWKYRKNHRFTEEKKSMLDDYLRYGGIKTGPNPFLGRATSADSPGDAQAEVDYQQTRAFADVAPDEEEEGIEVSFSEVAQVYFGNAFIRRSRFISLQDFTDSPNIIDAFLRYLEIRNVAPEYAEDIQKAREYVGKAKKELPRCKRVSGQMPGPFNKACDSVFGALNTEMDLSWMTESSMKIQNQFKSFLVETLGAPAEDSKKLVGKYIKGDLNTIKVEEKLEWLLVKVAEIQPYDPVAVMAEDCVRVTLANYESSQDQYKIYLERKIADELMVGMVATVTLCRLSNGEWYLEMATRICPTFYMEDECIDDEDYDY